MMMKIKVYRLIFYIKKLINKKEKQFIVVYCCAVREIKCRLSLKS